MTFNEYQTAARRTSPFTDMDEKLYHSVFGLASEAGEVAGILQKKYQGHKIEPEHFMKELGDCLWMIAEACDAMGFQIETVAKVNILKLMDRYPDGFDPEKSLHRQEGDI